MRFRFYSSEGVVLRRAHGGVDVPEVWFPKDTKWHPYTDIDMSTGPSPIRASQAARRIGRKNLYLESEFLRDT